MQFSMPLKNNTSNFENITVRDTNGKKVDVIVTLSEDGKTISVKPSNPYQKGELYYVTITDMIGKNGTKQKKSIRKIFIIE